MLDKLKLLLNQTLIYGSFQILGRFFTFLLMPLYTNLMDPDEYGAVGTILSYIAFLMVLYSMGMETAFFRFFKKDNLDEARKVYSHALIWIFFTALFFTIILNLFADHLSYYATGEEHYGDIVRLASLIPLFDALVLVPYGVLRLTDKAKRFASTRFILIVINFIANLILVYWQRWGVWGFVWSNVISSAIGVIIFMPDIRKLITFSFDKVLLKKLFRFGLPTLPASFAAIMLQTIDKPLLKELTNNDMEMVGVYTGNYKLGIVMMLFIAVFEYAYKPFYLNHYKDPEAKAIFSRVLTYFTMVCAFIFLIFSLNIEFLVRIPFFDFHLLPEKFWWGLEIVPIVLLAYYFNGLFYNFTLGVYITKKSEMLPIAVVSAAVVNIGINLLFIPKYGFYASAWATLAAYLVSAVILYFLSQKYYPIKYEWKRVFSIILAAGIVFFGIKYFSTSTNIWIKALINNLGLIGFLVLLAVFGFFTKSELNRIKSIIGKLRRR